MAEAVPILGSPAAISAEKRGLISAGRGNLIALFIEQVSRFIGNAGFKDIIL